MTDKEAIEILQEEHRYCQEPCYVMNAIERAITALREKLEREQNEPLTPVQHGRLKKSKPTARPGGHEGKGEKSYDHQPSNQISGGCL